MIERCIPLRFLLMIDILINFLEDFLYIFDGLIDLFLFQQNLIMATLSQLWSFIQKYLNRFFFLFHCDYASFLCFLCFLSLFCSISFFLLLLLFFICSFLWGLDDYLFLLHYWGTDILIVSFLGHNWCIYSDRRSLFRNHFRCSRNYIRCRWYNMRLSLLWSFLIIMKHILRLIVLLGRFLLLIWIVIVLY